MSPERKHPAAVPIGEVSVRTGVNSVTLRAWERRYGLLKPLRTDKGHRLYRPEDIERVKQVQYWLARGVAVSQVRALLDSPAPKADSGGAGALVGEFGPRLERALDGLQRRVLEQLLAELNALYPPALVSDQLLHPLLQRLRAAPLAPQPAYGSEVRLAFLVATLRDYFASALYRLAAKPQGKGQQVLLVYVGQEPDPVLPLMLAYSLGVTGHRVNFFGSLPASEMAFAAERLSVQLLLLYADGGVAPSWRNPPEALERRLQIPVRLVGQQATLCAPNLQPFCLGQTHHEITQALSATDSMTSASSTAADHGALL